MKKLTRTLMAYLMMICFVITLSHCVKENDSPRWDVEILGPVFQASLGINQLVKDSLLVHDDGGRVRLVYEGQWNDFTTDSVYVIPDTSINTLYVWPFFPLTIAPNTPFYTNNKDLVLNVRGAQLTEAVILSGKIRVTARNILPTKINFVYSVPEARKNGVSLSLQRSVGPGSSSSPAFFSEDIDFTGYTLNLTGALNNTVNTIAYNVVARTDSAGNSIQVVQGDTMVNLTTTLLSLTPQYVRGYLGQKDILENSMLINGIGNIFDGGDLFLDSASLDLDIENRIGADLQAYIFGINSVNTRTGLSVPLVANSVLARNLDISRGVETGIAGDPVRPSHLPLRLDASNSNISQFLQNLPDRIESDWRIRLNPLGNISGSNDFVYRDQLITAKTRLEIPFRLAMNQLSLRDTLELSESGRTSWDPIGPMTFTLVAENGFPIDLTVQLYTLDESYHVTDSIFVPAPIPAGLTDGQLNVISPTTSRLTIHLDASRKSHVQQAKYLLVRGIFSTVQSPDLLYLYDQYRLKLTLIADGTYSIR